MKRLLATFAMILFAACSGDNGTAPPDNDDDDNGGGGTVTHEDTVRVNALNEIAQQLDGWWSEGPDTVAARAVAYLNTIPLFEEVGREGPTSVWARFDDGRLLIIPNNLQQGAPEDTLALFSGESRIASAPSRAPRTKIIGAGRKALRSLRVPTKGFEIPKSKQFRVWDGLQGCFWEPKSRIRTLLTNGGYVQAQAVLPTVDNFAKNVHGDGVFVLFTHGAPGELKDKSYVYAMWTSTNVAIPEEGLYAELFDKQELVYMIENGRNSVGGCGRVTNYGITSQFVSNHMSFAENSLVYLNVCMSGTEGAGDMRQAFGNAGASVVVGWDGNVSVGESFKTVPYMIDRLLGANEVEPKEDPKQRAFNIYDVRENMEAVGRVTDPISGAVLKVFQVGGDFGLLAPTIQFLSVDDNGVQPKLIIAGIFGTDPGEANRSVTINGTELENISWSRNGIDCDIPESGANASGTVVVKVGTGANARESNEVNITEWRGELTYERDDPGDQTGQMRIKVRFLADIHSFRDKPGEDPFETIVLFGPRGETSIDATTSGRYVRTQGCTDTFTLGGDGHAKTPFDAGTDGSWIYFGSVDTKTHMLQLSMQMIVVFNAGTWVRTASEDPPCDAFSRPIYVTMTIEDCLYDDTNETTAFRMPMGDDFKVFDDERGPCSVDPLVTALIDDAQAEAKIKWGEMIPIFLPDPDAAR